MATGSELLIVDGVERDREGMRVYFDERGFVCTAVGTSEDARRLITQKFFPAALIALDVDQAGGGVDLVRYVRAHSRATSVVLTTGRRSFEHALEAIRAGALDVVLKTPDQVEHLGRVVRRATERYESTEGGDELFREVRAVLDDAFKVMLGMSRQVYSHLSSAAAPLAPSILVVDGEQDFVQELGWLVDDTGWQVAGEGAGGGALDKGMSTPLDIVASRDELMDLRGSMVVKSIQAQSPSVIGLVYSEEGEGRLDVYEQGTLQRTKRPFHGSEDLYAALEEVVEDLANRAQERRFIQAFSGDNRTFIKRYAELKLKIDRLISD